MGEANSVVQSETWRRALGLIKRIKSVISVKKKVQEQLEPVGENIEKFSSFVSRAKEAASASPKPAQLNASLKPVSKC